MAIEVHEGQAAAARQMAQGAAASSRITTCSVSVRTEANFGLTSRQHLETPFFGGFSDLGNCQNQHSPPHAMYTDLTSGEYCTDQDLWPTSGYHKQWPKLNFLPFSANLPPVHYLQNGPALAFL